MYLNKLQLCLTMAGEFRRTGKDNMNQQLARWQRYSFMRHSEPIVPIYPKPIVDVCKYAFVDVHPLDRTLDLTPINVGTVGHCDWPTKDW
jgi:hypothetical protein